MWSGCKIAEHDRILYFDFEVVDIYQQRKRLCLVAECILPQPNLILCRYAKDSITDGCSSLIIIDALSKYALSDNPQRQVLPNLPYFAPVTSYKPLTETVSYPLMLKNPAGTEEIQTENMNEYFLHMYYDILLPRRENQAKNTLQQKWNKELKRLNLKLSKQKKELTDAQNFEIWHINAETIKHNLSSIKTGQTTLEAINYFSPAMETIRIDLFVDKSPLENMHYYIKKYQKAKKGLQIISENITKTLGDIKATEDVLEKIQSGDIIGEMYEGKTNHAAIRQKISKMDKLLRIPLDGDWEIVIGRKATENDLITTQLAKPMDWWFHTRIYHGSHILLRNFHKKEPPAELVEICCSLAAWYSKAR
ncbi:MAG: NFACT RNA binding domain-containing protein, partial [Candidatus Cloacimonadaceae bacterium]|nr:NFACT RNA binding domain-containing protein [Candidatus Cloacimonadaceae bacterium]